VSPAGQPGGSEENREDEQPVDDKQQQHLDAEVEGDEKQHELDNEERERELQNSRESENTQQTVEENERQSPQQPQTEQQEISDPRSVNSQLQQPSQTQDIHVQQDQTERRAADQRPLQTQVQSKTSAASPEKRQQVAVVHGHERSYPRAEDRALTRIRDEERMFSMSRQPTLESHLSIESSTSSYQLSQASSLLWRNEQSQTAVRQQDLEQTVALQQQYEQLKNQIQHQLELQCSHLEREYQLREEQMRQQMMMIQWQCFTQQQQQQQSLCGATDTRIYSDTDTRCQGDPRYANSFPQAPGSTNITNTISLQPTVTELTGDRQRCGCDGVVQSNAGYDAQAVPAKSQTNHQEVRPVVVDVVSRSRGRAGAGHVDWPGYDGGHCRIVVGERRTATTDDSSDAESVEPTGRRSSGAVEWRVCPTCGLCRRPCDTSDGKHVEIVQVTVMSRVSFTSSLRQ